MIIYQALQDLLSQALERAKTDGILPAGATAPVTLDHPANPDHGDFASNVALRLAKTARRRPLDLAEAIKERIDRPEYLDRVEVASPGFLNFFLRDDWIARQVAAI